MKGTPVVLGLAVIVAGCADTGRRVEYVAAQAPPPRAHVAVAPPPLVVVAPTQLRMVWVPEWGVYVLEGHDVVHYESAYYAYSGGYWWIAQSHAGPWAIVAPPPMIARLPPGQFHSHVRRAHQAAQAPPPPAQVVVVPPPPTVVAPAPPQAGYAPAPRVHAAVAPPPPVVVAPTPPQAVQTPALSAQVAVAPPPPVVAPAPPHAAQAPPPPAQVAVAPPPPVVAPARPHMVWIPEWGVHVLQDHDVAYYDNAYYSSSGGHWSISQSPTGPWAVVATPPPMIAKLPPGQLHSHLPSGNHGWCPPGLAKQGRC